MGQQGLKGGIPFGKLLLCEGCMHMAVTDLMNRDGVFATTGLGQQMVVLDSLSTKLTRTKAAEGLGVVFHFGFDGWSGYGDSNPGLLDGNQ